MRGDDDGHDAGGGGGAGHRPRFREQHHRALAAAQVKLPFKELLEAGALLPGAALGVEVAVNEQGHVALVGAAHEDLIGLGPAVRDDEQFDVVVAAPALHLNRHVGVDGGGQLALGVGVEPHVKAELGEAEAVLVVGAVQQVVGQLSDRIADGGLVVGGRDLRPTLVLGGGGAHQLHVGLNLPVGPVVVDEGGGVAADVGGEDLVHEGGVGDGAGDVEENGLRFAQADLRHCRGEEFAWKRSLL